MRSYTIMVMKLLKDALKIEEVIVPEKTVSGLFSTKEKRRAPEN